MKANNKGFSVVEIIVARAIFSILVVGGMIGIVQTFSLNRLGSEETQAHLYAQEGIEAVRSIKNQDFASISVGTYGLDSSSGTWAFSGGNDTSGQFTRSVDIEAVQRDGTGEIVTSSGAIDPDMFKATVRVNWDFSPTRSNELALSTYIANFRKATFGDWSNPQQITSMNLSGSANGYRVKVQGNYAYLLIQGGSVGLYVLDISDSENPIEVGSLSLFVIGTARNLWVSGNYIYIASALNAQELQVIDVSNPTSPSLVGSYDLSGNANAYGITVSGNYAYLARQSNSDREFYVLNISNPTSPTLTGSLEIGSDANDVVVLGNYAYVASSDNNAELKVVDVGNPASPTLVASVNLADGRDGESVAGFGNTIVVGRAVDGRLHTIDVTNPLSPVERGVYSAGGNINVISVASNDYAFLATSSTSAEFQIINILDLNNPTLYGSLDLTDPLNGIDYDSARDRAFAASNNTNEEFKVFAPQ